MRTAKFRRPLTIALHPEVYDQIKQVTDNKDQSMAEWIRAAIDQALHLNRSTKEGNTNDQRV